LQVPERILQKRVATTGAEVRLQALIQWFGFPPSMATWEDVEVLRQRFPRAPAWGQAGSQQGGDVSSVTMPEAAPGPSSDGPGPGDSNKDGPRRSVRERRPNPRTHGPEWE
jgi:hypothetical protein